VAARFDGRFAGHSVSELRSGQSAGAASSFGVAAARLLRIAGLHAWYFALALSRWLLRLLWHLLRSLFIWVVTKSPLAESRRNAARALLSLVPWVLIAAGWLALTLVTLIAFYAAVLPDPRQAMLFRLPPNLTILARGGEFIAERGMRRAYVPYNDVPSHLIKAVLATEDRR